MSRPPRRQLEPVTEASARELLGQAIGTVLRVSRHAAELNLMHGPCEAVEANLASLQVAIDSAVRRCNSRSGVHQ